MLKKLRLKFVIINMTIVVLILALIFIMLYVSTARNQEIESIRMMSSIGMMPMNIRYPDRDRDNIRLPYFSAEVDSDGNIIETSGSFFDLSDEEYLEEILEEAKSSGEEGVLEEYSLRYISNETPRGKNYVFADTSNEKAVLHSLLFTFVFVGSSAFLIFLVISILLARWAVKPVEKAWLQQKQFVADASHELKTPLTIITTDAELLSESDCTETERKQLSDSIITVSGQMRGLVESLLELARIDQGSVMEAKESISFSELAEDAAMTFEPVFFENGMSISYEIEPEIIINGNGTQLKQLVDILLDNAVKYSVPGGDTSLSLQKTSNKRCILKVSNRGNPISEEDLKNLFKRFYRVDKARTDRHSYGLGLSIAESTVKSHNGKIRAESAGGYNSFIVEMPCLS